MSSARTEELLAANRALRESEERHARVVAATDEGIWDWNPASDEIFLSPRARQLFGIPEGVEIRSRADVQKHGGFHPEDRRRVEETVYGCAARGSGGFELEYRVIDPAGKLRWIRSRAKVFPGAPGEPTRLTGSLSDITERKRAEVTLAESEARFRSLTEISADFFWETDARHLCTAIEFGSAYRGSRALGAKLGQTRWEILPASPGEAEWNAHRAEIAAHRRFVNFGFSRIEDGEERFYEESGEPRFGPQGEFLGYRGIGRDVTERKCAELALRKSEERYARAMEASGDGHADWNIETGEFYVSPRYVEICGLPPGTTFHERAAWLQAFPFHPEDRAKWEAAVAAHFAGQGTRFREEMRIVVRGETRWLSVTYVCRRDAAGRPIRWTFSAADITERKRVEADLRASEARFRSLTALSSDWYWEQDENLRFTYLSARADDLTGYSGESSIGKTRWELENMTPLSCTWAEHQAVLAARQPFRELECARVGADRVLRYISMSGAPIFDEQGEFRGYRGIGRNITARKQAEQALRESEARKSAMFETALDGIVSIDHEGRVVEFNPAAERTFGYRRAEALGKELAELIIPPRLRAQHRQGLARYLKSGEGPVLGRRTEMPAVRADGSEFPVELSVTRIATEGAPLFTAYLRDITERKRAEEALRQSEERFALAVAGANEGIFDWDLVTDRMYMSQRAQELFGLPPGELWRPRPEWRSLVTVHPDDARPLRQVLSAHIAGEAPYDAEFRVCIPDGSVRWFRQRGIALRDASGKAYRMVGSIGDVTERHKAEEELSRLERQLRLAQRLEAMGTLAGGIAHDFNNILGAILGFSEMAWRDAPKDSRLQRDLESIATAGERGRALVERILAFSRSGVGERVAVHVEQVVREALDLLSAKLPPSVTLSAQLRARRAAMLGDPTQVHQVLMNLGTNAVQAMPSGGILRVSLDAVRCEAARAATVGKVAARDYVVLQVADSGTGIAPEILERIFDPFFTTKELGTGTGLGLSLVHGIVAELGGAIDVESTPGKGTAFTVHLPRAGDALDSSQAEELKLPRGDGQRVLVVDDEEPLVQLATRTLEGLGYRPVGFTSSAAALAAFSADPGRFDALIADERMPGLSGTALIREVRGVRRAIPILLMSGYVGGALASLAREAGANDVLKKPVLARDLATSLARVLQQ